MLDFSETAQFFWLGETVHVYHLIEAVMILAGVLGTNAFASPVKQKRKNF